MWKRAGWRQNYDLFIFYLFFRKKKRENDHELKKAVTKYDNGRFCSGFTEKVSLGQYKDPTSLAFTLTAGDIFL